MKRREFIQLSATMAAFMPVANACKTKQRKIAGSIIGASANIGHLVRDNHFKNPASIVQKEVVIVGGGISGLSAARWLYKNNLHDFTVLDLEKQMGGNAASGINNISAFPWAAHYVPIPNNGLFEYEDFLQECNVITGYAKNGMPVINEFYLCHDPQERLFINGQWQDGLIPHFGVPEKDKKEIELFMQQMHELRLAKGKDGKDAFAIPVDNSSTDDSFTALDNITMKEWLLQNNLNSSYLHWYVNYCTRDDFGTPYDIVSAWAGIHYFAGRKGKAFNADYHDVITWPEGNGWLSKQLQKNIANHLQADSLVVKVFQQGSKVVVHYLDVVHNELKAIEAKHCIMASPQFVNARLLQEHAERAILVHEKLSYVPWMVANITTQKLTEQNGAALSWDNVLYNSQSLGYVSATHQLLQQQVPVNNLTYYLPLTATGVVKERQNARQLKHADWVKLIMDELVKVHPNIENAVNNIDVMIWGHAMAQPLKGVIHNGFRKQLQQSIGNIHFAHTDLAGISIFEEGFYQGIHAAKKILANN